MLRKRSWGGVLGRIFLLVLVFGVGWVSVMGSQKIAAGEAEVPEGVLTIRKETENNQSGEFKFRIKVWEEDVEKKEFLVAAIYTDSHSAYQGVTIKGINIENGFEYDGKHYEIPQKDGQYFHGAKDNEINYRFDDFDKNQIWYGPDRDGNYRYHSFWELTYEQRLDYSKYVMIDHNKEVLGDWIDFFLVFPPFRYSGRLHTAPWSSIELEDNNGWQGVPIKTNKTIIIDGKEKDLYVTGVYGGGDGFIWGGHFGYYDTKISYLHLHDQLDEVEEDGIPVYEFTISNGETKKINIPVGSKVHYEVEELTQDGWELVSVNGDKNLTKAQGIMESEEDISYTFLNKNIEENKEDNDGKEHKIEKAKKEIIPTVISPKTGDEKVLPLVVMAGSAMVLVGTTLVLKLRKV